MTAHPSLRGQPAVVSTATALDVTLDELPALPAPGRVLLTSAKHFAVEYVINPHMAGNVGTVDSGAAQQQWETLRLAYQSIGITVETVDGQPGLCDMVFCANTTLPFHTPVGRRGVILSRMHAPQRSGEVAHHAAFFREQGYEVVPLPETLTADFEGMGDAIWHPGRYLLWGGYGIRTDAAAYHAVAELLEVPVLLLSLVDEDFYHLDTCFCTLDEESVLIYPGAFDAGGLALIHRVFRRVLEAPEDEARRLFACNAHCPDGAHVLIQRGCNRTVRLLQDTGYTPVELETGEFLKAGGSVFCMKQMFW